MLVLWAKLLAAQCKYSHHLHITHAAELTHMRKHTPTANIIISGNFAPKSWLHFVKCAQIAMEKPCLCVRAGIVFVFAAICDCCYRCRCRCC